MTDPLAPRPMSAAEVADLVRRARVRTPRDPRSSSVSLSVTRGELAALKREARARKVTVSVVLRERVFQRGLAAPPARARREGR